jgi:23S rRNA (adenine2030-N6)-methyltransferase
VLSYRHGFHAGNAADVLKHGVLIFCLDYLGQKEAPYLCIDTHSGAGWYHLTEDAENREWQGGIGRLWAADSLPPLLCRYAALTRGTGEGSLPARYPGSPAIIRRLLRAQDRGVCFELHPADFAALRETLGEDPRFRIFREDGPAGLKALLPPPSRRGCVFIDPSYEVKDDYTRIPEALGAALNRFPQGLYILWYPLLGRGHPAMLGKSGAPARCLPEALLARFREARRRRLCRRLCRVELRTAVEGDRGMYGSGLVIGNPPWTLKAALEEALPTLARLLGGEQGSWNMDWEEL